ncbi:hypothetical protein NPIL_118161 [Nephila pilipes]|uniref:Uncharacterized protein n=1 Tax=Nephila pilipes TaxID=299642 RepID=A0A8X6QAZ9_NEPPI|nr:hypothetical protein NPIL_118161 [Nephila pilipes]
MDCPEQIGTQMDCQDRSDAKINYLESNTQMDNSVRKDSKVDNSERTDVQMEKGDDKFHSSKRSDVEEDNFEVEKTIVSKPLILLSSGSLEQNVLKINDPGTMVLSMENDPIDVTPTCDNGRFKGLSTITESNHENMVIDSSSPLVGDKTNIPCTGSGRNIKFSNLEESKSSFQLKNIFSTKVLEILGTELIDLSRPQKWTVDNFISKELLAHLNKKNAGMSSICKSFQNDQKILVRIHLIVKKFQILFNAFRVRNIKKGNEETVANILDEIAAAFLTIERINSKYGIVENILSEVPIIRNSDFMPNDPPDSSPFDEHNHSEPRAEANALQDGCCEILIRPSPTIIWSTVDHFLLFAEDCGSVQSAFRNGTLSDYLYWAVRLLYTN